MLVFFAAAAGAAAGVAAGAEAAGAGVVLALVAFRESVL